MECNFPGTDHHPCTDVPTGAKPRERFNDMKAGCLRHTSRDETLLQGSEEGPRALSLHFSKTINLKATNQPIAEFFSGQQV